MAPKLSIVIPVYNVAPYLKKCVVSCFNQNIPEDLYEVILVNDGSTDNSLEISEKLKTTYPKIKLISQKNKGLSGARNTGLKHAVGEFVWFVDSDDWIKDNCLDNILKKLNANIDILWLGHDVWYHGKAVKSYVPEQTSDAITGEALFSNHLNNLFYIWKFIYNRNFLNSNALLFLEGILYEDLEFTPRALIKASKCYTMPDVYYHYLVREGSIANNIKSKNIEHRFYILNKLIDLLNTKEISSSYASTLSKVIAHTTEQTINLAARSNIKVPESGMKLINRIKKNDDFFGAVSFKFKLIISSPKFYYKSYKILQELYNKINSKK
ncbi:glycosyltransferase family 2 protein [Hwangdonia lutea]|uniref:Glycosyltransferase n=1 Tax=Hwangdonia lutea TaxID=3075823 RepID=A0AA97EL01_9FLAO|nr:glycosyltransferase [Hwangdonia sp. SCSIO 19198]WOD43361.1 glycosyltransferase [Hwangdonia sp. SCSIO 19198]